MRDLARSTGWSLKDLADKAGVPYRTFHNYVQEVSAPTLDALVGVCEATGTSLDWLVYGRGPMFEELTLDGSATLNGANRLDGTQARVAPVLSVVAAPIDLPQGASGLYLDAAELENEDLGEDIRALIRIHLSPSVEAKVRGRVSGFLAGIDPGEKNTGLARDGGQAGLARPGRRATNTEK